MAVSMVVSLYLYHSIIVVRINPFWTMDLYRTVSANWNRWKAYTKRSSWWNRVKFTKEGQILNRHHPKFDYFTSASIAPLEPINNLTVVHNFKSRGIEWWIIFDIRSKFFAIVSRLFLREFLYAMSFNDARVIFNGTSADNRSDIVIGNERYRIFYTNAAFISIRINSNIWKWIKWIFGKIQWFLFQFWHFCFTLKQTFLHTFGCVDSVVTSDNVNLKKKRIFIDTHKNIHI